MSLDKFLFRMLDVCRVPGPLAGDLLEERKSGRSGLWLTRQVAIAVAAALAREVAGHKLQSILAMSVGLAVSVPIATSTRLLGNSVLWFGLGHLLAYCLAGYIICRSFSARALAMSAVFVVYAGLAKTCLLAFNAERLINGAALPYIFLTLLTPLAALLPGLWFSSARYPDRQ
ncbi:MAG TPA: hypothetical protein VFQ91_22275 [Bryobacteraceae bacterium]|nr:hypothetical protein [Bryobacteraceae bacterium]